MRRSMFAYICLGSNDLRRAAKFYDATLGVLGYSRCDTSAESETSWNGWLGWGLYEQDGAIQDALWICKPYNGAPATVGNGAMVALWAKTWREVDGFQPRRSRTAEPRKARPVCGCCTTRISMRRTCVIRTATNSRWCAVDSLRRKGNNQNLEVASWRPESFRLKPISVRRPAPPPRWLPASIRHRQIKGPP